MTFVEEQHLLGHMKTQQSYQVNQKTLFVRLSWSVAWHHMCGFQISALWAKVRSCLECVSSFSHLEETYPRFSDKLSSIFSSCHFDTIIHILLTPRYRYEPKEWQQKQWSRNAADGVSLPRRKFSFSVSREKLLIPLCFYWCVTVSDTDSYMKLNADNQHLFTCVKPKQSKYRQFQKVLKVHLWSYSLSNKGKGRWRWWWKKQCFI